MGDVILSGQFQFDHCTQDLKALERYAAHESGHSYGLTDCRKCDSVMAHFPGPNRTNEYVRPTEVDLNALRLTVVRQ